MKGFRITKKQNVKVNGVKYVASPLAPGGGCAGCAFYPAGAVAGCHSVPCMELERDDRRSVIFIETSKVAA